MDEGRAPAGDGTRRLLPLALLAGLAAPSCVAPDPAAAAPAAQQPAPADGAPAETERWTPPPPEPDGADWLRLVSGEWLRGELGTLRNDELKFDSDKLGDQVIDWDDVAELRSTAPFSVLRTDRGTHAGRLFVDGDRVRVGGHDGVLLPRGDVSAFVRDSKSEADRWTAKIGLGLTHRSGNTEQTDATASGLLRRETPWTRWETNYRGAYSQVNTADRGAVRTADNHRLQSRLDWFVAERLFVTPGFDLFRDPFQNVSYRLTPYVVAGGDLVDRSRLRWSLSAGPAYQRTRYESVIAPADDVDGTLAALLTSRVRWDVTSSVDLDLEYTLTTPVPDTDEYNHHLVAALSVDLGQHLDLDLSWVWDRFNRPLRDSGGALPEKDDFRLAVQLGVEF